MGYDPTRTFDWNKFWKNTVGFIAAAGFATFTVAGVIASVGTLLIPVLAGAAIGASASVIGQGIGNVLSGKGFFDDISLSSVLMAGLAGASFATGIGGLWGAVAIGAESNAGMSAFEQKSWANIGLSVVVGGVAAGVGKIVGRYVFKNSDLVFKDVFDLAILDTNKYIASAIALRATYYTFLPGITTGITKGFTKFLGNKGISYL